ncbi:sigma-54-dependent Fis family transcriptional regulator [Bradymonadaceae bacterium TMQ3]|uniref:Sigma-54-dependent Fis family transcriptional regulator n=1 Tax=Lujinxingia sediminis TaxID=2480984 RepID=A0ABY0CTH2_9DELT|nr:sigma-54 dependent transcriptional regulator [Lujinxingia sediminis]RDV38965.1 sigma-54-dependent Fis family transcriptional regulator [Bradymonadaceae bacterium TMQ3]RVU44901.1 sigma-54-dependent Fis family transcriptional regulator [Lujinxingia sediminis]TXC76680.1 sigma-54-dependent Fis family transcriptional regulator [Bradymonadales bacterium TMQ1]
MDAHQARLLLVDDEVAHLKTLERLFLKEGYQVATATGGQEALDLLREQRFELVLTDLMMPDIDGMDLLKLVQTLQPQAEVILMTAFGTVERAVLGMKEGAYDFVAKPIKRATILKAVRQALERQALVEENRELKARLADLEEERSVVGQAALMREAVGRVRQVAPSDATVLITGESGTGKELFARMIGRLSKRADKPFVTINCAALPEALLESELFGYEKGAFTGATQRKIGRFEAADGGTLFLDEIGELSPQVQVKLLRVLQEGTFERLGSNTPTRVDVRVVAATHKDLEAELREGTFREDLYYRLNVIDIKIPPLRHRMEDVPLLSEHFLRRYNEKNHRQIAGFTPEALQAMEAYHWPGNVRELENVVERAVVLDRDEKIDVDDLPAQLVERPAESRHITIPLGTSLEEIEKRVLHETLKMTQGDKNLAAKLLGIATRTIYRKL